MSVTAAFRDPFVASSLLTAINAACTAASLDTFSTGFGIQPHRLLLKDHTSLPAMAAHIRRWSVLDVRSGGTQLIVANVVIYVAAADTTDQDSVITVDHYLDVVRATVETTLKSTFNRLTCQAADLEGQPFQNATGIAARLGSLEFEVEALYTKGTT